MSTAQTSLAAILATVLALGPALADDDATRDASGSAKQPQSAGSESQESAADSDQDTGDQNGSGAGESDSGNGVVQACMDRLSELNQQYRGQSGALSQREMRNLFNAASIFANAGQKQACTAVIAGIEKVGLAPKAQGGNQQDAERSQDGDPSRQEAFAQAERLDASGGFATQTLLGSSVIAPNGAVLADVEDIVATPDTTYLILGSGGFLDIGEAYSPVRMERLLRIDRETLGLRIDEQTFESAPHIEQEQLAGSETGWTAEVDSWWDSNLEPADTAEQDARKQTSSSE